MGFRVKKVFYWLLLYAIDNRNKYEVTYRILFIVNTFSVE